MATLGATSSQLSGNDSAGGGSSVTPAFMLSTGIFDFNGVPGASQITPALGTQIGAILFTLTEAINFTKLTLAADSTSTTFDIGFAIYDENGGLIWQSGGIAISNTGAMATYNFTPATALILQPGNYYFAWTADVNCPQWCFSTANTLMFTEGSSAQNVMNGDGVIRAGIANQASTTGAVFPSSITLRNITISDTWAVPCVNFHN